MDDARRRGLRERGRWAMRALVMAAWVAGILWLGTGEYEDDTLIPLAAAISLAAGLLVGTWWALAVPAAAAFGVMLWDLVTPDAEGTRREITWMGELLILGTYAVGVNVFIGLGVVAHKTAGWLRAGAPFPDG